MLDPSREFARHRPLSVIAPVKDLIDPLIDEGLDPKQIGIRIIDEHHLVVPFTTPGPTEVLTNSRENAGAEQAEAAAAAAEKERLAAEAAGAERKARRFLGRYRS